LFAYYLLRTSASVFII